MRRLLCISNSIADTFKWRTAMGLSNEDIIHFSPYQNASRYRGYKAPDIAIVWVDRPRLSPEHMEVINMYRDDLGVLEFAYNQPDKIRDWLALSGDARALVLDPVETAVSSLIAVEKLIRILHVVLPLWCAEERGYKRGYNRGWSERNRFRVDF